MDTVIEYTIRLEDGHGIQLMARLDVSVPFFSGQPPKMPRIRILEWLDYGEVKQGINLKDSHVHYALHQDLFPKIISAIVEKKELLLRLPLGERMLLAYAHFYYGERSAHLMFRAEAEKVASFL